MDVARDNLADVEIKLNDGEVTHGAGRCGLDQAQRDPPAGPISGG